jgi:hypothetical protein
MSDKEGLAFFSKWQSNLPIKVNRSQLIYGELIDCVVIDHRMFIERLLNEYLRRQSVL